MSDHQVTAAMPPRQIEKKAVEFVVRRNGKQFGRLFISQGGLRWVPSHGQTHRPATWQQFAQFMEYEE